MRKSCSIGIIFRIRAIRDNKNLHILIQSAPTPKTVTLITINLIERLSDCHSTSFQFYMDKRQTIHKNRHIIAVIVISRIFRIFCGISYFSQHFVLVNHLQTVIMYVSLIDQPDILRASVITL